MSSNKLNDLCVLLLKQTKIFDFLPQIRGDIEREICGVNDAEDCDALLYDDEASSFFTAYDLVENNNIQYYLYKYMKTQEVALLQSLCIRKYLTINATRYFSGRQDWSFDLRVPEEPNNHNSRKFIIECSITSDDNNFFINGTTVSSNFDIDLTYFRYTSLFTV